MQEGVETMKQELQGLMNSIKEEIVEQLKMAMHDFSNCGKRCLQLVFKHHPPKPILFSH